MENIVRFEGEKAIGSEKMDVGQWNMACELLGVSFMFLHWLTVGWDWMLKDTDRHHDIPPLCADMIGQTAYKLGVETRILQEVRHPVECLPQESP
jgi:hypothetical protein